MFALEMQHGHGGEVDSVDDIRAAVASFMRLERPVADFDCMGEEYLKRLRAHITIFRAFNEHLDVMRRDRHQRLLREHELLEQAVIGSVAPALVRGIIEDVRVNTTFAGIEGRPPHL